MPGASFIISTYLQTFPHTLRFVCAFHPNILQIANHTMSTIRINSAADIEGMRVAGKLANRANVVRAADPCKASSSRSTRRIQLSMSSG